MIAGIIPARFASSRFPGKPLADIRGKSMLQRVYEQASASTLLDTVVIATDDTRIFDHARSIGAKVVMTAADHPSGTDRCWEALNQLDPGYRYVINIQGDEPFLDPNQIDELAAVLQDGTAELATQMIRIQSSELLFDRGEVKIILDQQQQALYFSRMPIPFIKGVEEKNWHLHFPYYRHVGMYAYRRDILEQITRLPVSSLEKAESLEQLRWLEHGFKIRCVETRYDSHCIDTPEDIEKVLALLSS